MAEEQKENKEQVEQTEATEESKPKKKSNLLVIVILLLVVVLGALGAFFLLGAGGDDEKEEPKEEVQEVIVPTVFFEVPEIIVSLSGNTSNIRYLKLVLSFELASEVDKTPVEKLMPKIIDEYQTYLRQLRLEDLRGSVGTYRLKESLLLRANQVVQPVQINNVLIKEMLIQ